MISNYGQMISEPTAIGRSLLIPLVLLRLIHAAAPLFAEPIEELSPTPAGAQSGAAKEARATIDGKPPRRAKTMTIAGTCEGEAGQPIRDATVRLFRVDRGHRAKQIQEVRSDRAGHYRFPRLESLPVDEVAAEAYYSVVATSPGRASQIHEYVTREMPLVTAFTMPPAATLSGRVTDPEGTPVSGAYVWTRAPDDGSLDGIMSATTDLEGRFAISDLAPFNRAAVAGRKLPDLAAAQRTSITFNVRHADFAEQRLMCLLIPDKLDIKLEHGGVIEGRVVDAITEAPAPGVLVSVQGTRLSRNASWHETLTDSDGRYRLAGLAPLPLNVWATAADRTCAALDSVQVVPKQTRKLPDLRLVEGGWIEGSVLTTDDRPVRMDHSTKRRLRVGLHGPSRPQSGAAIESVPVDDEGRFRFRVPAGLNRPYVMSQTFRERAPGLALLAMQVNVRDGETANVTFRVVDK
jgi:protocatechuate 3,4-dioxygenase beta subunit